MFTAIGQALGELELKFNRDNAPYYYWEEKNYYLFAEGHFWSEPDFRGDLGDLTTIIDNRHVNIGHWRRQFDDSIFVYAEPLKQGYVLLKSSIKTPLIYWATVITPSNTDTLGQLALQGERNSISGNPIV
jgi:hypothetical protein